MNKLTKLASALAFLTLTGTAVANPVIIDADSNAYGIGSIAQGAEFTEFGFQITNATSKYFDTDATTGISVGDMFVDQGSFDSLTLNSISNDTGFTQSWGLSADYSLYGAVVSDGTATGLAGGIAGGFLNIFYNDLTDNSGCTAAIDLAGFCTFTAAEAMTQQVLSIAVSGSSGPITESVGVNLTGIADYSFLTGADSFVENFFNLLNPMTIKGTTSNNLFDLYTAGLAPAPQEFVDILAVTTLNGNNAALDPVSGLIMAGSESVSVTGLSPLQDPAYTAFLNVMSAATGVAGYGSGSYATASRGGEILSGNINVIDVPEPASIALLGLGLIGFASRKKLSK